MVYPMDPQAALQYEARGQHYMMSMADIFDRRRIDPVAEELRGMEGSITEIRKKKIQKSLDRLFKKHAAEIQKEMRRAEKSNDEI